MRLTQVLNSPPIFRYWKHFGAGFKNREPNFKHWRYQRIAKFDRREIPDHTLPIDKLPAGARVLDAQDLMESHIDEMPDQLLKRKENIPVLYDHPWPFNIESDPFLYSEPLHCYSMTTRFYRPQIDCQVLTNSLIETDSLEAHPPLEPTGEHMENVQRQIDWAVKGDSVLIKLPKDKSVNWPKLNLPVYRSYGLPKERIETNVMNILTSYAQTILAKHYHESSNRTKLEEIFGHRTLAYPHCFVPFERGSNADKILMDLFIDSMIVSRKPLPQIEAKPSETSQRAPTDIKPRTWRSLLEKSRHYSSSWSFTLPRDAQLHTIQLGSRIMRKHSLDDEMLARLIVHAFGLASQFARLREVANENVANTNESNNQTTCVLQDPLEVKRVNQRDLLDQPIVLQAIGYDHHRGQFRFVRYQLNTLLFDDQNPARVKNLVWHSGPISDMDQVLRYYLDFHAFDSTQVDRMLADTLAARQARLEAELRRDVPKSSMTPGKLAESY